MTKKEKDELIELKKFLINYFKSNDKEKNLILMEVASRGDEVFFNFLTRIKEYTKVQQILLLSQFSDI